MINTTKQTAIGIYKTYKADAIAVAYVMTCIRDVHITETVMANEQTYELADTLIKQYVKRQADDPEFDTIDSMQYFIDMFLQYINEMLDVGNDVKNNTDLFDLLIDLLIATYSDFYEYYDISQSELLDNIFTAIADNEADLEDMHEGGLNK